MNLFFDSFVFGDEPFFRFCRFLRWTIFPCFGFLELINFSNFRLKTHPKSMNLHKQIDPLGVVFYEDFESNLKNKYSLAKWLSFDHFTFFIFHDFQFVDIVLIFFIVFCLGSRARVIYIWAMIFNLVKCFYHHFTAFVLALRTPCGARMRVHFSLYVYNHVSNHVDFYYYFLSFLHHLFLYSMPFISIYVL